MPKKKAEKAPLNEKVDAPLPVEGVTPEIRELPENNSALEIQVPKAQPEPKKKAEKAKKHKMLLRVHHNGEFYEIGEEYELSGEVTETFKAKGFIN